MIVGRICHVTSITGCGWIGTPSHKKQLMVAENEFSLAGRPENHAAF